MTNTTASQVLLVYLHVSAQLYVNNNAQFVGGSAVAYFGHAKSDLLLQVTEPCKLRTPEYFVFTVMNCTTVNTTTVRYDHHSGSQVTIKIELPQNVDMCSLVVTIRAGNSAGMSSPTEIEVGRSHHVLNHDQSKSCVMVSFANRMSHYK